MALRSVVVEAPATPPTPRRTVVLRTGGPAARGDVRDVIFGVLGALLLIGTIALAYALPDKSYLDPQFRLTFVDVAAEGPGSDSFDFVEGSAETHDFVYEVLDDNVKSIVLEVGFLDDIQYSFSDSFDVDLIAPNGTLMGHFELTNPEPRPGAEVTAPPVTEGAEARIEFLTGPAPTEQIVAGLSHSETVEQAQARLEPQHRFATKGQWIVRVTLNNAQDCPQPGQGFESQPLVCRFGPPGGSSEGTAQDGNDLGNRFLMSNFSYTYYVVSVQELS